MDLQMVMARCRSCVITHILSPLENKLKTPQVTHLAASSQQLHCLLCPPSPGEVVLAPIRHREMGHRHSKTECFHWKGCWVTSNDSLSSAICPQQVVCSRPEDREGIKSGVWPLLQTNTSF